MTKKRNTIIALMLIPLLILTCAGATLPAVSCPTPAAPPPLTIQSRPFLMGFTRWPPEATAQGVARMNAFLADHGDLTAIHLDGGIPWNEALNGVPLPSAVMNEWKNTREAVPAAHQIYLALTPINTNRNGLAEYWKKTNNEPLPAPWNAYAFDNAQVKKAYLNYVRRAVNYFHPDYLAIGIEANIVQVNAPEKWAAYKRLHRYIYTELKKSHPDLPIFLTFSVNHMNGLDGGDTAAQKKEIKTLLPYSDIVGLSAYPYGWAYNSGSPAPIPQNFFDVALSFGKPIAIAESGVPSRAFTAYGKTYKFSEAYQAQWIKFLLKKAYDHNFVFVVNWTGIDFDKLLAILPPEMRELARFWAYTGLEKSNACAKRALPIWDDYLNLPYPEAKTLYGFFPSPPQVTIESVFQHYEDLGQLADFVLFQHNVPWLDFVNSVAGESRARTDIINQQTLATQNGLGSIYVVDALNGLNRREFKGLPVGWEASFANPQVRAAFKNYTLWVVRTFHPRYLGLASEINTYMDAYPNDAANFVSLYHEVYAQVKAEAPNTQVFVTFQWDDLNNMWPQPEEGHGPPLTVNWEQVEAYEPHLDLWVISSYPYFIFPSGADIPADYYSRLLDRTDKPVAVAEGGWTSRDVSTIHATPADQVAYLNAIHNQMGSRLAFWVYLLLNDIDMESYIEMMEQQGVSVDDITTLSLFASLGLREMDGTPKPALEVWMGFRR
ncbi:MAG: hypothetical protein HY867_13515 [Chloroflexi bacterium]|nr:hypothetical protein [Chloroflexota bacterium]